MMRLQFISPSALAVVLLSSCATPPLHDEYLTPTPRFPAALTYFGGPKPHLRTWSDFYFYPNATAEFKDVDGRWAVNRVVPGPFTAVTLDEGSVIENTTAHPQYYEIHLVLPAELSPGQKIPLRTPAAFRRYRKTSLYRYSRAQVGELAISGMTGYLPPVVRPKFSTSVGTATVLKSEADTLTLKLDAVVPVRVAYEGPESGGRLHIDRTYVLRKRRPEGD